MDSILSHVGEWIVHSATRNEKWIVHSPTRNEIVPQVRRLDSRFSLSGGEQILDSPLGEENGV